MLADLDHLCRYAKSPNNSCIAAQNVQVHKDMTYRCLVCNEKVSFVQSHERFVKSHGIATPVRAHFRHQSDAVAHSAESYAHMAAKTYLMHNIYDFVFVHQCSHCNKDTVIDVLQGNVSTEGMEQIRAVCEFAHANYRYDIAVVKITPDHDAVIGCVEICHTHPLDDSKIEHLMQSGIAWVEVRADEVLQLIDTENETDDVFPKRVRVYRCALQHDTCFACQAAVKERRKRLTMDEMFTKAMQYHRQYVLPRFCPSQKITFGRYSGQTLAQIYQIDRQYIQWLAQECNTLNARQRQECLELLQ